ncbi:transglycosylase domain-containing protein [Streptomyces sp. NPDC050738]|uniref:transglycosylase domain-containing protein n=1 Tax=Streptomyces sp. NPDC050738 TaxID=3154744 RepID=UPI00343D5A0D
MSDEQPDQQHPGWTPRDLTASGPGQEPHPAPGQGGKPGKTKRPKRTGWRRFVPRWRWVLGSVLGFLLLCIGLFFLGYALVPIPDPNDAATAQSNVYLYADGKTQLAIDGAVNREDVPLSRIALTTQHATLAAEDRNFYNERGISITGTLRGLFNTVTGKGKQSGSTITQQYVKNYYLGQEQTIVRKIKELFISIKVDRNESKDEILAGYLNTSYFGRNAYGIQAASQAYFSKDADEVTLSQSAFLATLLNAPSAYDVAAHPENKPAAKARWQYVINGMLKEKWITQAQHDEARFPDIPAAHPSAGLSGQRGYIVEAVKNYLDTADIVSTDELAAGGYRITTTLQKSKQDDLTKSVKQQVTEKLGSTPADSYVQIGAASIEPDNAKVRALYGGTDYLKHYISNATRRDFAVGSTFKPFIFTSAVQNNSTTQDGRTITPYTIYNGNSQREVQGPDGPTGYAPPNEDGRDYGNITVSTAMDNSVNAVFAQMAEDVGTDNVSSTATDLGVPKKTVNLNPGPSMALGVAQVSPLDMAHAYATLANHGNFRPYTFVEKLTKNGDPVTLPGEDDSQNTPRDAADTTTSMLTSVVQNGTGSAASVPGWQVAGKTGTIDDDKAAWFAGYTPKLATVVAMMGEDPKNGNQKPLYGALGLRRINGGGPPAQIWGQYTAGALANTTPVRFDLELQSGASPEPTLSPSPSETPTESPTTEPPSETPTTEPPTTEPPSPSPTDSPTFPTESPTFSFGLPDQNGTGDKNQR